LSSDAERLAALFAGSEKGHGTHAEPVQQPGTLKWEIKSTARTVREAPTLDMWQKHLSGERPFGPIPIRADGKCRWGSIDIDQYEGNVLEVIARVERAELPLVATRSKSGGLHLYAFLSEWMPAEVVLPTLKHVAAVIGHAKAEIFPKQMQLAGESDLGNWLCAPYLGSDFGGKLRPQVGLKKTGAEMELSEFLAAAEKALISPPQLASLRATRVRGAPAPGRDSGSPPADGAPFSDGPPCLQHLVAAGLLGDGRKRALFHMGVYFKRAAPEGWRVALERANQEHMQPPLPSDEVAGVVRSLGRKDYHYKCKEEPMVSHCDSLTCRSRRFGVGEGQALLVISGLSKLDTNPPIWFVDVEDRRIEATTEQLQNYQLFHRLCMDRLNRSYGAVKQADWFVMLGAAMLRVEMVEAPPEVGAAGQFAELLEEYLTNRARAEKFEDLPSGRPWLDEDGIKVPGAGPRHYFRLRELQAFLAREGAPRDMTRGWVTQRVKAMGGGHHFFNVKGKGCGVWYVPAGALEPAPELELPRERATPI
jgi:TOTE conflict system primase-like protein